MNANQELLQKLRRQRLRMGEDDLPAPVVPEPSSHTPTRMVQERHQGDLQSKLNRQRQRMGEASQPEKEKPEKHQAQTQPVEAHVKVKQRAMSFLGGHATSGPSGVKPGRINLCSWEDKCRAPGKPTYTKRLKEVVDADLMPTGLQSGANLATINEERRIRQGQTAVRSKDAEACHASAETEHVEASPEHGDAPLDAMYPEEEGPLGKENYVQSAEAESGQAKDDTEDVTAKSRKVREAECFFMWDSDDDTCSLQEDPISERQSARNKEAEEPLEFSMLDYLAELPEGVAEKLHNCLKTHEELVRRLCQRNDLLRAHIRNLRREASEVRSAPFTPSNFIARSPRSPQSQAALQSSRAAAESRQKRQPVETKIEVTTATPDRARFRDEQHEANLRARLQRTIRASRERVQAMQRRVQREEIQMKHRFEAALHTRDGLEKSIKAALKEQGVARVRIGELEEAMNIEAMKYRAKEKERDQLLEKQNAMRNEIKALRNRALKHQQRERRIQDLQCEVEALTKAYHPESPRWTL